MKIKKINPFQALKAQLLTVIEKKNQERYDAESIDRSIEASVDGIQVPFSEDLILSVISGCLFTEPAPRIPIIYEPRFQGEEQVFFALKNTK